MKNVSKTMQVKINYISTKYVYLSIVTQKDTI